MIITGRLAQYKSGEYCNLDMFRITPPYHDTKRWVSKDKTKYLIKEMETMHLWHIFNMLMNMIDGDAECKDTAINAIQYVGHELFKRKARAPKLPGYDFKKQVNRAENLHLGFMDAPPVQYIDDDKGYMCIDENN